MSEPSERVQCQRPNKARYPQRCLQMLLMLRAVVATFVSEYANSSSNVEAVHEQLRLARSLPQTIDIPVGFVRDVDLCSKPSFDSCEMRVVDCYGSDCGSVACPSNHNPPYSALHAPE